MIPSGANGTRLEPSNAVKATMQKNARMPIFRNTMIVLAVADSLVPRSSRNPHMSTTAIAGTLNTPPFSPGGFANSGGICRPNVARNSLRYCPQPTATAATETPYSSIRHQPHTHATSSPSVA